MKCAILVMLLLFLNIASSIAQSRAIDSLHHLLATKESDKITILIELARENNVEGFYDEAINFSDRALELASGAKDTLKMVMAMRFKSGAFRRSERLEEALTVATLALEIAKRNNIRSEIKILLNSVALIYNLKGQYDLALDYNLQSLAIREAEGNKAEISIALHNIGFIYFKLKNDQLALTFYNRALKIKREIHDDYDMSNLLINIGLSEVNMASYEQAVEHFTEALASCKDQCSEQITMEGQLGLGKAYYNLREYQVASGYFRNSYQLAIKIKNYRFQSENLLSLSRILIASNDLTGAKRMLTEAEQIASTVGYNQVLLDTYKELITVFKKQANRSNELEYEKKYKQLQDILISEELMNNITMIQSSFEEQTNLKSIDKQSGLLKTQEDELSGIKNHFALYTLITIVSFILIGLLLYFAKASSGRI